MRIVAASEPRYIVPVLCFWCCGERYERAGLGHTSVLATRRSGTNTHRWHLTFGGDQQAVGHIKAATSLEKEVGRTNMLPIDVGCLNHVRPCKYPDKRAGRAERHERVGYPYVFRRTTEINGQKGTDVENTTCCQLETRRSHGF